MEFTLEKFKALDDKIVVFGMSCSGKTTFSNQLKSHFYFCFDELFKWHLIETLGLSIQSNLLHIKDLCESKKSPYVLDGWHLSDQVGEFLPEGAVVYLVWAPYEKIISQYRIPVVNPNEFRPMYKKWYLDIDYKKLPSVRYFKNDGNFMEISESQFITFSRHNPETLGSSEIPEKHLF